MVVSYYSGYVMFYPPFQLVLTYAADLGVLQLRVELLHWLFQLTVKLPEELVDLVEPGGVLHELEVDGFDFIRLGLSWWCESEGGEESE